MKIYTKHNRTSNAIKNVMVGMGVQVLQVLTSLVCRVIFVRFLNETYLGISGLFSNIISVLSLAELGIGSAIIYELYATLANNDEKKTQSLMVYYKKAYMLIGCIIGLIGLIIMPFVNKLVILDDTVHESVYTLYILYLLNVVVSYFFFI